MEPDKKKITKRWALTFVSGAFAVALALLYVLVLRSLAAQISPPPGPLMEAYPDISTQALCDKEGGRWIESSQEVTSGSPRAVPVDEKSFQSYCQGPLAFERARDAQSEKNSQTSLFVFMIGGALAVVLSLLVDKIKPIAPGLMIGGIAAFLFAAGYVWTLAPGIGKLVTVVVAFGVLVGVGLYVFREHDKE